MGYSDGEALILTAIRAHANFDSNNTRRANWKILDSGNKAYYAIIKPSEDPAAVEFITPTVYVTAWHTVVEVWYRYEDDATTQTNLYSKVNDIIGQMQTYKDLNTSSDDIQNAEVVGITPPMEQYGKKRNSLDWLKQEVIIEWLEQSDPVTYA